jgi:acetyl-CoA acetyltransferase
MGQTAEVLVHLFDVSRRDADAYAVESHLLARAGERLVCW